MSGKKWFLIFSFFQTYYLFCPFMPENISWAQENLLMPSISVTEMLLISSQLARIAYFPLSTESSSSSWPRSSHCCRRTRTRSVKSASTTSSGRWTCTRSDPFEDQHCHLISLFRVVVTEKTLTSHQLYCGFTLARVFSNGAPSVLGGAIGPRW